MTPVATDPFPPAANQFTAFLRAAVSLDNAGLRGEALEALQEAEVLLPDRPESAFLLGGLYERFQYWAKAAVFYGKALQSKPEAPRVWHRLGIVHLHEGALPEALEALEEAVSQAPEVPDYATDLSMVLSRLGRFEEALGLVRVALTLRPDDIHALNNAGHVLQCLNRSAEAVGFYDAALLQSSSHPVIRFGRATALLKAGSFLEGWQEYEWRWQSSRMVRTDIEAPVWEGEDLQGRTILVHHEQGYGDTLHFIRLVSLLAARGACVVVQVPVPLVRLMERVEGVDRVFSVMPAEERFDYHCAMMSLPARLGLESNVVGPVPYLSVPDDEIIRQGNALRSVAQGNPARPDFIVGLVWGGDPRPHDLRATQTDRRRSISLKTLEPLFSVDGIRFVSFQMGMPRHQIEVTGLPLVEGTNDILDFQDTGARLYGVDLLITVDTSIAHLAGGLGLPVWMLSRADSCWRWGERGTQTGWYPTMRIFRQSRSGDWESVVETVCVALERLMDVYRSCQAASPAS
ncbi:O-linked N-acetylglucosamine transferase/flagellin modification protein FlbA [Gluconobacter thailandicus F149-1 = NBRC 100600]|uniref:O-linked N-acetylglucosamine transferase n=1 Tax=Gluconobacter thailandicus NBRC 3257 TaxID=1381097 RepID=A0ABQ0IV48_GLUTH|nr:tetratricopeptide repeat protein [Gluconobacter thailandicus]KXV52089.1 hypothetical protein AD946_14200 [Gluconobacter thailandicus]GAC86537.1 hypothetical protein NBRC3255_0198 [Gluconobacter thailandicus NBRC 3255]GAD26098.1 hypothetical protein NBRC3257_1097 [Gluconobacter thailandicus NBRC 3257]GAN93080.1 O-linked N-acetylglucosamine transferase/flagellin modification protein FlbA [Gluconobacter thailandicus F149-1 = NBRC 100600]GBR59898.1 hypothetical protein AA100600_1562 [Gluconobac